MKEEERHRPADGDFGVPEGIKTEVTKINFADTTGEGDRGRKLT